MRDLEDGITPYGGDLTVLTLVQMYILQKTGVRHSTEAGYKTVVNLLKKDDFGARRIDKVKLIMNMTFINMSGNNIRIFPL